MTCVSLRRSAYATCTICAARRSSTCAAGRRCQPRPGCARILRSREDSVIEAHHRPRRHRRWRRAATRAVVGAQLPRRVALVAAGLRRGARDLPARARGRRQPRRRLGHGDADLPNGGGDGAGAHGHGRHPLHGQGWRRPPQPRGQHRLRAAPGLPVAARARLHRQPGRRRAARLRLPLGGARPPGHVRRDGPRAPRLRRAGDVRRGRPDDGPGERHPRHGVECAERRRAVGDRGRRLHRARRPVGRPAQRARR